MPRLDGFGEMVVYHHISRHYQDTLGPKVINKPRSIKSANSLRLGLVEVILVEDESIGEYIP
jgi:hypothetical protein